MRISLALAASLVLSAASVGVVFGQTAPVKHNVRERSEPVEAQNGVAPAKVAENVSFSYEFTQPTFVISHMLIVHDATGQGTLTFERKDSQEPVTEPVQLSPAALQRIQTLWKDLKFLDVDTNYQSERQFPHLGTMKLGMKTPARQRVAEFNWTNDKTMWALVNEYRYAANQALFVFNITLSRENQPLEAPQLMQELDRQVTRGELSDAQQLIPLLEDLSTDERIPLIARNHAGRILKKIKK
jgi:hypothetical protein